MKVFVLTGAWIASTVAGFWWYDGRYQLPIPAAPAQRPSLGRSLVASGAKATLLAFYNPDCACSRFALPHVRDLARRFDPQGAAIRIVVEGTGSAPAGLTTVSDPDGSIARAFGVPAAPGAVLLDPQGRRLYVGGFNVARFCDDPRTAFAEQALVATLAGRPAPRSNAPFYGCAAPTR